MSPVAMLRAAAVTLLVLAVIPLVTFFAVGYVIPIALLVVGVALVASRPRPGAALIATAAVLLGGGVLWAGWILGVLINGDPVSVGLELFLGVLLPLAALACLVAAVRVWRTFRRSPVAH